MPNNPEKDSFVSVAKRNRSARATSGILPPNTRLRAKSTNQQKSSVPTQIDATLDNVDDSSRISNKSASSSHYKELFRQQEAEKQKLIDQLKAMQDQANDYKSRENDLKSTINGLEFNLETSNITNNRLRKEVDQLDEQIHNLSAEKDHQDSLNQAHQAKVVADNKKLLCQEKEKFAAQMRTMQDHEQDYQSTINDLKSSTKYSTRLKIKAFIQDLKEKREEKFNTEFKILQENLDALKDQLKERQQKIRTPKIVKNCLRKNSAKLTNKVLNLSSKIASTKQHETQHHGKETSDISHLHAKASTSQTKSSILTQIDSKPPSDESSRFSGNWNKSICSHLEARFEELLKKREQPNKI